MALYVRRPGSLVFPALQVVKGKAMVYGTALPTQHTITNTKCAARPPQGGWK